ncbi:MAG: PspC domain-containing protein [Sphingomonadales bacterium]
MTAKTTNPLMRDDTVFGVCQAIGDDFGFSPMLLRIPLAVPVVFAPWYSIGAYAVLGVAVLASRFLFPDRKRASVKGTGLKAVPATAAPAVTVDERELELLAA